MIHKSLPAPSSPPSNVMATVVSSTEIVVTWDMVPPTDRNGVITMYEVFYQPLETFGGVIGSMTVNVTGLEMSTNLEDLQEYVNYTISVRAYTYVGEGPYSDGVTILTLKDGTSDNIKFTNYDYFSPSSCQSSL